MRDQLTNRLEELQTEFQKGQERLASLEQETANIKTSLLRISGAIQVLKEELEKEGSGENNLDTDDSETTDEAMSQ